MEAKPRAYFFKARFITALFYSNLTDTDSVIKDARELSEANSFEALVQKRLQGFKGKTTSEIHVLVGQGLNPTAKDYCAALSQRMLGVTARKIAEFEKAGIQMKTIRLKNDGTPKEHMSFPYFKYKEIINEKWEADEEIGEIPAGLRAQLEQRFFFIVFQCDNQKCRLGDEMVFKGGYFWTMPQAVLDGPVRKM